MQSTSASGAPKGSIPKNVINWAIRKIATAPINHELLKAVGMRAMPTLATLDGQRASMMESFKIATVIDVGGHVGAYARDLRKANYRGIIISFEPDPRAFARLSNAAQGDSSWTCVQTALGSNPGSMELRLANIEGGMTSLLPLSGEGSALFPQDLDVPSRTVDVTPLDQYVKVNPNLVKPPLMIKLDTQGFEFSILEGAQETLQGVSIVEIELPLRNVYEGARSFSELTSKLEGFGFQLVAVHTGRWLDGFAVDCDCLFVCG